MRKFEILSVLKGNLDPVTWYIDDVAYANLDVRNYDPVVNKMLKL